MRAWGITDKGAVRPQNQDSYYFHMISDTLAICVVCDGMGGARAGNVASQLAAEVFVDTLRRGVPGSGVSSEELLAEALRASNLAVYHRARQDAECHGMGTTLVACLVRDETVSITNVGDSRAYVMDGAGISRMTRDHSLVEDLVQRGEITPDEAKIHPQKNLITRALGAEPGIEGDFYSFPKKTGTYLLLCSDGLSNVVSEQEILYEVLHGPSLERCCDRLLKIAFSRGAPDNVTAVLLQL